MKRVLRRDHEESVAFQKPALDGRSASTTPIHNRKIDIDIGICLKSLRKTFLPTLNVNTPSLSLESTVTFVLIDCFLSNCQDNTAAPVVHSRLNLILTELQRLFSQASHSTFHVRHVRIHEHNGSTLPAKPAKLTNLGLQCWDTSEMIRVSSIPAQR